MRRATNALAWPLLYLIAIEAMLIPAILYWPEFTKNIGAYKNLMPIPALRDLVGTMEEGGVAAYVVVQHFFKGCNTLGCAAAALFAVGSVASEANKGTLEIWLARPVSRTRLLLERYVWGALAVTLPILISTATIPMLLEIVDETLELRPLMLCALHQALFLLALYSLTFLASTVGRNPVRLAAVMLTFTILQYALYFVKKMTDWSIFRSVDFKVFQRIYDRNQLELEAPGAFLGISVLMVLLSIAAFRRRVPT